MHCITLAKENGNSRVAFSRVQPVNTLLQFIVDWSLTTQIKQWERNVFFPLSRRLWGGMKNELP